MGTLKIQPKAPPTVSTRLCLAEQRAGGRDTDTHPATMASAATAGDIHDDAMCSMCLGYLTEPVTLACGHNFCRACLTQHREQRGTGTPPTCPQCRAPFWHGEFKLNTQLNNIVQKLQQLGPKPEKGQTEGLCERHQERLKFFCEDDGEAICLECEKSQDHKSHAVVPIKEAVQEYKVKLQEALGPLRKELEEAWMLMSKEEEKIMDWKRKVKQKHETITREFNKLHMLLREEEQLLLQRLEEEERETLQRLQENVSKLSQQSSSLQQLIAEIEGKCQQPVTELLKDVKNTLSRSENVKLQEPETVSTDLKKEYDIFLDMKELLKRFRADVTLDPDTAHPKLILSEDRKRVMLGDTRQTLPDTPERFDLCVFVLGAEGFTGRRRYWEVEVGNKTRWALGVCRESVSRKGPVTLTPEDGYWSMCLTDGEYKACTSSTLTPLSLSTKPGWVGIFLDYEVGEVSFYNATDGSHLCSVSGTFSGMLRPFFSPGRNAGGTNTAPLTICPAPAQVGGNLSP
nr:E3 ubiquitin-protein ligase TRIM39-like [Pelodiscus sinensis]|eukprot:XP_014428673.2 E3 ubiquitin-protein ligase TRIM39-like [Pelodiscus sinensis]